LNISPGDERLRDRLQELNVQVAEQRYRVAQQQAECLQTPDAHELASRLEEDWRREELDVAYDRYHRWPGRADLRMNLALLLKQQGRFEEVVPLLQRPAEEMAGAWREQLELGECLQYLRRFDEAYSQYQAAIQAAGKSTDQRAKLARFRAGSLALALGNAEAAVSLLEELVAIDRSFPDALEKLNEARGVIAQSQSPKPPSD
jgi:tetratricopeptide (TPR) repeat protein